MVSLGFIVHKYVTLRALTASFTTPLLTFRSLKLKNKSYYIVNYLLLRCTKGARPQQRLVDVVFTSGASWQ